MKKKSVITLSILMVLTTGCLKSNKEQQTSTGKIAFQEMYSTVFDSLKKSYDKDVEEKGDKKPDSHKEKAEASKSDDSKNEQNATSGKSANENPITKQETSPQQPKSESDSRNNAQSTPQKEPPKEEPIKPKPPVPACDDTIPAGAYEDEDVAAAFAEKLILDNLKNGDGSITGYSIENGQTACGTRYYILKIY